MEKVRYGVMGTGKIVDRFVSAIRASKESEVYAICSRSEASAKKKAEELDIATYYGTYEALVSDDRVDVVYIPTINHAHKENALLALAHGKHVVVEKPMTLSFQDTQELFEEAERKNCFIMEAQKSLFLPVTLKVRQWLQEKKIGKLQLMEYDIFVPDVSFQWFYDREKGGGALMGSGNYIFSHGMLMENTEIVAVDGQATMDRGVDLQCTFLMKFRSGVLASGKITTLAAGESKCTLYGELGKIIINDFWKARNAVLELRNGHRQEIAFPVEFEMVYEVDHVSECLGNGLLTSPVMTRERSLAAAEYTDRLYQGFWEEN